MFAQDHASPKPATWSCSNTAQHSRTHENQTVFLATCASPSATALDQISSMQQTLLQKKFYLILCFGVGSSALLSVSGTRVAPRQEAASRRAPVSEPISTTCSSNGTFGD
jgi:hypothetical protein